MASSAAYSSDAQMRAMGFGRLGEQLDLWPRNLRQFINGEAVRCLLDDGALPEPGDPAPARFAFIGWEHDIGLMKAEW